jgi:hypothetical protein
VLADNGTDMPGYRSRGKRQDTARQRQIQSVWSIDQEKDKKEKHIKEESSIAA